jgi:MscS family membrane protein
MRLPMEVRLRLLAPGLLVLALAHAAPGEQLAAPAPTPVPQDENAGDPYGRDTPRGCFFGFLKAAEKGSYANAAEYLQIPGSLRPQREQIAAQFQEVLDQRFVSTSLERMSRSPRGTLEDGLPPNVERVGEILGPDGSFDVVLVRRESPGAPPVWLISWDTIREARQVYGELGASAIARKLPEFLAQTRIGPLRLWQVAAFLLLLPVLFGLSWLLVGGVLALVRLLRRKPGAPAAGEWTSAARSPATLLLALLVHRVAVFWLGIPVMYRIYYNRFLYVVLLAILLWMLLRIVDVLDRHLLRRVMPTGRKAGASSLSLVRRALRGVAIVLVLLLALPVFGVNVTATLAGLGIGGLVLAFAAQKSLENVFGGFAILSDRPLSVGDTCRGGGHHALGHAPAHQRAHRGQHPERRRHDGADREPLAARQVLVPSDHRPRLHDDAGADGRRPRAAARPAGGRPARREGNGARPVRAPRGFVARRGRVRLRPRGQLCRFPGRAGGAPPARARDRRGGRNVGRVPDADRAPAFRRRA